MNLGRTALLVGLGVAGCGRLDFDPVTSFSVVDVRPAWSMPAGRPIEVVLDSDATGATVTIGGAPCTSPTVSGTTISCIAAAHAPGSTEVVATTVEGADAIFPRRFVYVTPGAYQFGGSLDDNTSGVAIDRDGNVFVTGGTVGDLDGVNQGDFDAVLVKYDASGTLAWVRQLGSPLYDYARDVAVDPSGNVTIAGYTAGALSGTNAGSNDIFVARYSPDGQRLWVAQTGSAGDDQAWDLGVDDAGNVSVAVQTTGALAGGGNAGGQDYAIVRYSNLGVAEWARQDGTIADDFGHSVVVTPNGISYLVGYTTGALAGANAGGNDMFVARYETDGTRSWIRQRGTIADDLAQDVQVDLQGDVWVAGRTTGNLDGNTLAGGTDVFAMRFDAAGTWVLTRQYGGSGNEDTFGISASSDGVIYMECNTSAAFDGQSYAGGPGDVCMIALTRDGTHVWTRITGTAGTDNASSCAVDNSLTGLVYLSAITNGSLDIVGNRGGNDIAVLKYDATGAAL